MSPTSHFVATLTIILEDVEPQVRRKLIVPLNLRMDRLHRVLQVAYSAAIWMRRRRQSG